MSVLSIESRRGRLAGFHSTRMTTTTRCTHFEHASTHTLEAFAGMLTLLNPGLAGLPSTGTRPGS